MYNEVSSVLQVKIMYLLINSKFNNFGGFCALRHVLISPWCQSHILLIFDAFLFFVLCRIAALMITDSQ